MYRKLASTITLAIIIGSAPILLLSSLLTEPPIVLGSPTLQRFISYSEMFQFLNRSHTSPPYYYGPQIGGIIVRTFSALEADVGGKQAPDYSTTNIQVEGVDEPDTVKTDGRYLYVLADQTLYIIVAYPAEEARVLSKISFKDEIYIRNFFINKDYLIVFGGSYNYPILYEERSGDTEETGDVIVDDTPWDVSTSVIKIYDISNREHPVVEKEVEIDGSYFDSRMIGNYVYVIATEYTHYIYRTDNEGKEILRIPELRIDDEIIKIPCDDIYYIDVPEPIDTMTHVLALNLDTMVVAEKSFLIGVSQTMYVSKKNIYLVYTKYNYNIQPLSGYTYEADVEKT